MNHALHVGVVIPVKPVLAGKSRLAPLGDDVRRALALGIALDTIEAAVPAVDRVLVTTDDLEVARAAQAAGALVLPDGSTDLNDLLTQAAAELDRRSPGTPVAALCADLPALRPTDLRTALQEALGWPSAYVPDRHGSGTTLYVASGIASFDPRFGLGSAQRHRAAGATPVGLTIDRLRTDVDTPMDLAAATVLGLGAHSIAAMAH